MESVFFYVLMVTEIIETDAFFHFATLCRLVRILRGQSFFSPYKRSNFRAIHIVFLPSIISKFKSKAENSETELKISYFRCNLVITIFTLAKLKFMAIFYNPNSFEMVWSKMDGVQLNKSKTGRIIVMANLDILS